MPIFVTEPGRPVHNRLPEALRARRVETLAPTTPTPAAEAQTTVPEEIVREQQRRRLHARQAIEEYSEGVSDKPERQQRPYLPASRLLTRKVFSVSATATLSAALETMESRLIHHLVVETDSQIAGLIDMRWLLKTLCEDYGQRSRATLLSIELPAFLTATTETDAHELARQMLANRLDAALVLDGDNRPQGVITSSDYLRLYAEVTPHEQKI